MGFEKSSEKTSSLASSGESMSAASVTKTMPAQDSTIQRKVSKKKKPKKM